jgi:hypothetical protein
MATDRQQIERMKRFDAALAKGFAWGLIALAVLIVVMVVVAWPS